MISALLHQYLSFIYLLFGSVIVSLFLGAFVFKTRCLITVSFIYSLIGIILVYQNALILQMFKSIS